MYVLLLILAVLGVVVVLSAVLENTAPMTVTLFGQEVTGLSDGELLAAAAGLGFLVMLLLALAVTFSSRRRARRHDFRAGKDDLADRVAELERENYSLRESSAPRTETAEREPVGPARTETAEREPVGPARTETAEREPVGPARTEDEAR